MLGVILACRQDDSDKKYPFIDPSPGKAPDRIFLSVAGNPSNTIGISWRTSADCRSGSIEVIREGQLPADTQIYKARTHIYSQGDYPAAFHRKVLEGLHPGTDYRYRVSGTSTWSPWYGFHTADEAEDSVTFLYLGDAQKGLTGVWKEVIRSAERHLEGVDFILQAGDQIDHSTSEHEWGAWFRSGKGLFTQLPSAVAVGNHEYVHNFLGVPTHLTPYWYFQFNFPGNGPPGLKGQSYYFDYGPACVIVLNSNEKLDRQSIWLENILGNSDAAWKIILMHHPLPVTAEGRNNEELRERWKPLFEKYHVDLVLQGHDHTYARGRFAMGETNRRTGPVYVVSVSGSKMYHPDVQPWMICSGEGISLYQKIHISDSILRFNAYTRDHLIYDSFELKRTGNDSNTLIETME